MVWTIDFFSSKLSNAIGTKYLPCYMQRETGMPAHQTSVTLKIWWREVVKNVALPPASELALPSDNTKLNFMGLKVDNLCNH